MISVSNLSFEYEGKVVLHDVSFEIEKGSVVALVGPNGAGKTTLMRCLAALHDPVAGEIFVDGIDAIESPRAVRLRSGYLSDFFGLYDNLTVRQSLVHMAGCQYVPHQHIQKRVDDVIRLTGLEAYEDARAGTLSRGYRQRLGVGLAIIHKPKFLLLDEPASGMDPEARVGLSALIRDLNEEGMTIIVSSHILAELEDYCSDMLVIRDGRVRKHTSHKVASDEPEKIAYALEIEGVIDDHIKFFETHRSVSNVRAQEGCILIDIDGDEADVPAFMAEVYGTKIPVIGFERQKQSLQKVYMDLAHEDSAERVDEENVK